MTHLCVWSLFSVSHNYEHLSGNVKVFCRSRPLFEDEGPSAVEFPDDFTIRVNTGDESLTNPKKDYEFDRVYGPHIGQGKIDDGPCRMQLISARLRKTLTIYFCNIYNSYTDSVLQMISR